MKIAFDHQIFNSQSYGGISRYYTLLVKELLALDQDVGIFAGIHQNNYLADLPENVVRGIKLAKYPPKSGRAFRMLNHYLANTQIKNWQPDIIHETYYSSMSFSNYSTIPRVTTVYDMIHELFSEKFSARDKTSDWKRKTFERVNHIISISHSTKKDLIELFGIDESKITVVHLGVDSASFLNYDKNLTSEITKPFLLYVGARGGYKNFNVALKAIAQSSQLKNEFDLVAFGGGSFSREEKALISSLGFVEDRIRQVSGSDETLKKLYHQASAFIYPSLYEGFGLPPLEAMACSCPVISSNTSSLPEVIGDAGEYFNPNSLEDIQQAIEAVIYSPSRIMQLKERGLERVKLFGWDKCGTETLDVYKEIIGYSK